MGVGVGGAGVSVCVRDGEQIGTVFTLQECTA